MEEEETILFALHLDFY